MENGKAEMILCIVNHGYQELVMETAKKVGVTGGTFINAHGTSNKDAESFFGISINPEKEIVLLVVSSKIKNDVLSSLYDWIGLNTDAQGICFSVPVSDVSNKLKNQLSIEEK